jgi:hypothetical protein
MYMKASEPQGKVARQAFGIPYPSGFGQMEAISVHNFLIWKRSKHNPTPTAGYFQLRVSWRELVDPTGRVA